MSNMVRDVASRHEGVCLAVKECNLDSVSWLYHDTPNITFAPVEDDVALDDLVGNLQARGMPTFQLGFYCPSKDFNAHRWVHEQHRQAGYPAGFWENPTLPAPRNPLPVPREPYVFMHDDPKRGYIIRQGKLPSGVKVIRATGSTNIFDYLPLMRGAQELHLIDSCFLCMVELAQGPWPPLVWHQYARRGLPPEVHRPWRVLN